MNFARKLAVTTTALAAAALPAAAIAGADPAVIPFQINPAPFGNPNGSFDAFPGNCVAVVGALPGTVTIAGGKPGGWGCYISSTVQWLNLTTGVTGTTQLSNGLNGIPAQTTFTPGPGQLALILTPASGGTTTPGFATFYVP
ncbi:hypothetical protein [Nocardia inohanensis]|uniref:hypothetical protein n=1 Tax=Nocardia inohanensis TaxID=209246 RepID=UPI000831B5F6|nr:hypothetical protein [Nocardia inohanensis]